MKIIKNKRILAVIGIICLILGNFLPCVTFSFFGYTQSIALWGYWEGKVILVLTLANALFIFEDFIKKYIPQLFNNSIGKLVEKANNPKFSLIPTILVAAFAIYMVMNIDVGSQYLNYGIGFYLIWIGVIALVGHAIFFRRQDEQIIQARPMNNYSNKVIGPQQSNVQDPNQKYCPQCGNPINESATSCFMCGYIFNK